MVEVYFKTWNGSANVLDEELLPIDVPHFDYGNDFAVKFNQNPIETFQKEMKENAKLSEYDAAANFLLFCSDIYPKTITSFIFNQKCPFNIENFLFSFFSSFSLEYVEFHKAMSACCSHIAFPNDIKQTEIILKAIVQAYLAQNPYVKYNEISLLILSKALVFMSAFNVPGSEYLPMKQFHAMISSCKMDEAAESNLYNVINKQPIPLFFTFVNFTDPPGYKKTFIFKKKVGLFKTYKNRYYIIDNFTMKYFKDPGLQDQAGEIDIESTITEFVPKEKKESAYICIKNIEGKYIGYKISKNGERKKRHHIDYFIYSDDDEELKQLMMTLNLLSYLYSLCDTLRINPTGNRNL